MPMELTGQLSNLSEPLEYLLSLPAPPVGAGSARAVAWVAKPRLGETRDAMIEILRSEGDFVRVADVHRRLAHRLRRQVAYGHVKNDLNRDREATIGCSTGEATVSIDFGCPPIRSQREGTASAWLPRRLMVPPTASGPLLLDDRNVAERPRPRCRPWPRSPPKSDRRHEPPRSPRQGTPRRPLVPQTPSVRLEETPRPSHRVPQDQAVQTGRRTHPLAPRSPSSFGACCHLRNLDRARIA